MSLRSFKHNNRRKLYLKYLYFPGTDPPREAGWGRTDLRGPRPRCQAGQWSTAETVALLEPISRATGRKRFFICWGKIKTFPTRRVQGLTSPALATLPWEPWPRAPQTQLEWAGGPCSRVGQVGLVLARAPRHGQRCKPRQGTIKIPWLVTISGDLRGDGRWLKEFFFINRKCKRGIAVHTDFPPKGLTH